MKLFLKWRGLRSNFGCYEAGCISFYPAPATLL